MEDLTEEELHFLETCTQEAPVSSVRSRHLIKLIHGYRLMKQYRDIFRQQQVKIAEASNQLAGQTELLRDGVEELLKALGVAKG